MRGHLVEVERKIAGLAALGHELRSLIGQCRRGTVAECRIIEALAPGPAHAGENLPARQQAVSGRTGI